MAGSASSVEERVWRLHHLHGRLTLWLQLMSADDSLFQAKPLATRDAQYANSVSILLNATRAALNDVKWHQVHGSWLHFWTATTRMIIYIDNSRITSGDDSLDCRVLVCRVAMQPGAS